MPAAACERRTPAQRGRQHPLRPEQPKRLQARAFPAPVHYRHREVPVNENFSLIVMCFFLLASLAFLAEQLTSYH